ncbi:MAG TPA: NifB/NifX family molybdenum-iron cluster-binding protein [Thermoanaerobaculia bacterium]|nr:NifB/NifX family molybdenum-iron cluster-binding protein [Thermoanaerobaculia bacterium]
MKVAISTTGEGSESPFDSRFGRTAAFCLVDRASGEWTRHENPAQAAAGGAGVEAARFVVGLGAGAVISGAYGPHAFATLAAAGVEMYLAPADPDLTVAGALALLQEGSLRRAEAATHAGHHGSAS